MSSLSKEVLFNCQKCQNRYWSAIFDPFLEKEKLEKLSNRKTRLVLAVSLLEVEILHLLFLSEFESFLPEKMGKFNLTPVNFCQFHGCQIQIRIVTADPDPGDANQRGPGTETLP
jgi:hypothetical protein